MMKVLLYHNASAGRVKTPPEHLQALLADAGFDVVYLSKGQNPLDPERLSGVELVVVAGGDGTVAKALHAFRLAVPRFAILPLGTANNIARSLGIGNDIDALARGLAEAAERPFDIGRIDGPAESRAFVEAVGLGPIAASLTSALRESFSTEDKLWAGREALIENLCRSGTLRCRVAVDGAALPGKLAMIEILNIPITGPGIRFPSCAAPGDGLLDVAFLRPERKGDFIDALRAGRSLPVEVVRGRQVDVALSGAPLRIDDELAKEPGMEGQVRVGLCAERVAFLVPDGKGERHD